jgi:Xaa-Pro aminopeptidase
MERPEERLTPSVSNLELERRWKAVREQMREEGLDFLVMQNDNEWLGGYVRWFTDFPAKTAYPITVIFSVDDEMTTITCGGKPPGDFGPPAWALRGVKRRLTAPYFRTLFYSNAYDAERAVDVMSPKKKGKIGFVGKGMMPATFYEYLRQNLSGATFIEATDLVDRIKAIKSDEEIALIKQTAALQDEAMAYAKKVIRPGRRDFEIVADIIHKVTELGSEEQYVLGGSGQPGTPVPMQKRRLQNRVVKEGDLFNLMVEVNGPGGMYTEIARIFCLGKVPPELEDALALARETQQVTLKQLKPGADPVEIARANNAFLATKGFPPETRLYAHGQGYDLVERPAIRDDEPMKLQARMNITVHPILGSDRVWAWVCDNYLITETGGSECLHKTPQKVFAL